MNGNNFPWGNFLNPKIWEFGCMQIQEFGCMQTTYFDILLNTSLHLGKKMISTSRVNSLNLISSYLPALRKNGLRNLEWAKDPREDSIKEELITEYTKQCPILNRTLTPRTIKKTLLLSTPNKTLTLRILKRTPWLSTVKRTLLMRTLRRTPLIKTLRNFRSFYTEKSFGILVVIHDRVVNGDNIFIKELRSWKASFSCYSHLKIGAKEVFLKTLMLKCYWIIPYNTH